MTTITSIGRHSGSTRPQHGFIAFVRRRWQEHQMMRTIESMPYDIMKDVGFPGAERTNEK